VADCSHDTATCDAFENAVCVHTARAAEQATEEDAGLEIDAGVDTSAAFCFERCRLSGSADGKCHELEEVACEPLGAKDTGFCRPVCSVDSQCPHGACDRRSGACVDRQPRTDTTFGTPCEIDRSDCDGLCIDVNEKQSLCTHRCVFGAPGSCVDPATEGRRGGCVVVTPGGGIGDVGYCMPLCECADNCPDKTSVCDPFKDTTLEKTFGTAGVCTDKDIALNEPLECK
jgi:hypothetical protein